MANKSPVLIVDDDQINQVVVAEEVELGGYDTDLAGDGREALEKVKARQFRLIIMDCQMPVMNGFRATQEIRKWEEENGRARTPIVALTGHNDDDEKARALSSGMDDFIAKPFRAHDLIRIMAALPPPDGRLSEGPGQEPDLTPGVRRSKKLLEICLMRIPEQLRELRDAQQRGAVSEVQAHAHKLKGSCLALEAKPMAKAADGLELRANVGDLSGADALITELEERFLVVKGLIQQELDA